MVIIGGSRLVDPKRSRPRHPQPLRAGSNLAMLGHNLAQQSVNARISFQPGQALPSFGQNNQLDGGRVHQAIQVCKGQIRH